MTLDDARSNIGNAVVYLPDDPMGWRATSQLRAEQGVITSVNDRFVFVRYGSDVGSKSPRPENLRLLGGDQP